MPGRWASAARDCATAALAGLLAGCATYSEGFAPIGEALVQARPERALARLEQAPPGGPDRVLDLMNRGTVLQQLGRYEDSNADFEQAKRLIERLRAPSVTEFALRLSVNEAQGSFVGAPHEQVMLHLMMALNFLSMGDLESARVEALQMDLRLRALGLDGGDSPYREDAFARYLAGLVHQALGERDDALIAYLRAIEIFAAQQPRFGVRPPPALVREAHRLARMAGRGDDARELRERFPEAVEHAGTPERRAGRLVVVMGDGLGPIKSEVAVHEQHLGTGELFRIAVPAYVGQRGLASSVRLQLGARSLPADPVADIEAIARATLAARMDGIIARALGRAVVKHRIVDGAREHDEMLGVLANVATFATERADTRSWTTLPSRFFLAFADLPPGRHVAELRYEGARHRFEPVELAAGETRFLFHQRYSPRNRTGWGH
jgi:hypothetical protein